MSDARLQAILDAESSAIRAEQVARHPLTREVRRVAIFAEAFLPKVDGVTRTALLTVRYLEATGREVIVFAPNPALPQIGNICVVGVPSLWLPEFPESRAALLWPFVWRRLRAFRPDLIHLFSPFSLGVIGMLAGHALRVPVVANYQTDLPGYARSYGFGGLSGTFAAALRFIHNGCHLTLAPSRATFRELRDWHFKRLRMWGRGVDARRFTPARRKTAAGRAWRERLLAGRDPGCLVALYVGRIAREKHLETLRGVAHEPGVALTLVGDGHYRSEVRQALGQNAVFLGPLLGEDLANAYAAADCFVFPGPEETFGQVVLEAMASGLPVIVTRRGGPASFVAEGESGFLCPVDDAAAFAERIRCLRDDPARRAQMSAAARRYAEGLPWMDIMRQLEGYYGEAARLRLRAARLPGLRRNHPRRWLAGLFFFGCFAPLGFAALALWIVLDALFGRFRRRR